MTLDVLARSEALHARVRAFASASIAGEPTEPFDALACDLARFQANSSPTIARLWAARGLSPADVTLAAHVPAVPTDAFKLTRIAAHPPEHDAIVFRTSGTTVGTRGEHPMRTTATYEHLALLFGEKMLRPDAAPVDVLVLAPPPSEAADSSLNFMCRLFGERWSGGAQFLLPGGKLDLSALTRRVAEAHASGRPVMLLATSFALVHLLDEVGDLSALKLPPASRVMQTGGYKGKSREVSASELRAAVARTFNVDERAVISEYGMTELSSQFYEGSLRALLGLGHGAAGVLVAPPWLRITPVDPETLMPVAEGQTGIARIEDLGNVDSSFAIQTQDRIELTDGGFRLLGRLPGATPRGCSLAIEELLDRHA